MELRTDNSVVYVTNRDGRIDLHFDGESYSAPGEEKIETGYKPIGELFPDWQFTRKKSWSMHTYTVGPYRFLLYKQKKGVFSLEIKDQDITIFTDSCGIS